MDLTGGFVVVLVALVAYAAFYQWTRHQRRMLLHRERLAALEKGAAWPAVDQEVKRSAWAVQRVLVLAGLTWVSLAVGAFVLLHVIAGGPPVQIPWEPRGHTVSVPLNTEWVALAPFGIGVAHLLVFALGRRQDG